MSEQQTSTETLQDLKNSLAEMSQEIETLRQKNVVLQKNAQKFLSRLSVYESGFEKFYHAGKLLWTQPSKLAPEKIPPFVPIQERPTNPNGVSTRFVSFINFKGGVGKTTLSANLAAAFANGNYRVAGKKGRKLRVLTLDLDFQGTLSHRCVGDKSQLEKNQDDKSRSTAQLLTHPKNSCYKLSDLMRPFVKSEQSYVIPVEDSLAEVDDQQMLLLALNRFETRFYYRLWLHNPDVFQNFDLVVFDCPPRITASSLCALVASDFAFIPTSPDIFDVHAVIRTTTWLLRMSERMELPFQIGGIILNRTSKESGLSSHELNQVKQIELFLRETLKKSASKDEKTQAELERRLSVLKSFIPRRSGNNSINGNDGESLPGADADFFSKLATEIYQRIYE